MTDDCTSTPGESHRGREEHPYIERPASPSTVTEAWSITPEPLFNLRGKTSTDLCSQCSQIDFKAIFSLDPNSFEFFGQRTCSFSGLSRSMLKSTCPTCRIFSKSIDWTYVEIQEPDLISRNNTIKGELVAVSSLELCKPDQMSRDIDNHPVMLKVRPLVARMPYSEGFWEKFRSGSDIAHDVILPAAPMENAHNDPDIPHCPRMFCYGYALQENANYSRILAMLHRCQHFHDDCHVNNGFEFPQNARVIDCITRQIVPMVEGLPYIALSYMWGGSTGPHGSRLSESPSPPDFLPKTLPQMIQDTLNVTVRLDHRYLWVDWFCIDQCHSTDKAFQIQQMASIYSHACITLCALVDYPALSLPGVSRPCSVSGSFRFQNATYISLPSPDSLVNIIKESTWNSRGWTFQEAMLSKRCLFFTDKQVSLVCRSSHQTETVSQLTRGFQWGSKSNIFDAITENNAAHKLSYEWVVNHYQQRGLSYQSDALNAFRGLLSLAPTQSYYGIQLPQSREYTTISAAFAHGLLWQALEIWDFPPKRRLDFPSWSWLSRRHVPLGFDLTHNGQLSDQYKEFGYKRSLRRALGMWIESTEKTWVATISIDTPSSGLIPINKLFRKSKHLKVVPEEAKALRLESFIVTYQILRTRSSVFYTDRKFADVRMEPPDKLPFELPRPENVELFRYEELNSYVKFLYDDVSCIDDDDGQSRLAILLIDNAPEGRRYPASYWLAIRPAYFENGRQLFYREGIIVMYGELKWKENCESAPRNEIWLT